MSKVYISKITISKSMNGNEKNYYGKPGGDDYEQRPIN